MQAEEQVASGGFLAPCLQPQVACLGRPGGDDFHAPCLQRRFQLEVELPAHVGFIVCTVHRTAVVFAVVSGIQTDLDFLLRAVCVEGVLLSVDGDRSRRHIAVFQEVVPLAADGLPAGKHSAVCAEVVLLAAHRLEPGLHGAVRGKAVLFAVHGLDAGSGNAVRAEVIALAVQRLPAGLHLIVLAEIIAVFAVLCPAGGQLAVRIVIADGLVVEDAQPQFLGAGLLVQQIADTVHRVFSGHLACGIVHIIAAAAVADPAFHRLSRLRVVVSPHPVYGAPAGLLCAGVVEQIGHAVDLLRTHRRRIGGAVIIVPGVVDLLPARHLRAAGVEQIQDTVYRCRLDGVRAVAVLILSCAVFHDPAARIFLRRRGEFRQRGRRHSRGSRFQGYGIRRRRIQTAKEEHSACRRTQGQQGKPLGIVHFSTSFLYCLVLRKQVGSPGTACSILTFPTHPLHYT